jgi:hypothetical protein
MIVENFFPRVGKFVALEWNGSGKMIEETQARRRGGAGVINQCAVDVEEDHVELSRRFHTVRLSLRFCQLGQ